MHCDLDREGRVESGMEENERVVEGLSTKRRCRELKYCDHCKQFVSNSTFYRHCLELPLTQPITPLKPVSETAIAVDERILLELDIDRGA